MVKNWREYEWGDVVPLPVPQNDTHLAQIAYSNEFLETMSIFRAVQVAAEISERALAVTTAAIQLNPANYSAWDYRFDIVKKIGNQLFDYKEVGLAPSSQNPPRVGEDGTWLNEFTLKYPKNYQVWNYRQLVADPTNELWYKGEKVILDMVFEDDGKNFHAWSHYKFIIQMSRKECPSAFDPAALLKSTEELLDKDVLNNSVWSFRYFLFIFFQDIRDDESELEFIAEKITVRPGNESAWSYLNGYVSNIGSEQSRIKAKALASRYADTEPRALETLADLSSADEAKELWKLLGEKEPSRKEIWTALA